MQENFKNQETVAGAEFTEQQSLNYQSANKTNADTDKRSERVVTMTEAELSELMAQAYRKEHEKQDSSQDEENSHHKNNNSTDNSKKDCGCKKPSAAELLVKGLASFAGALLRPGRRSVWPPRRG